MNKTLLLIFLTLALTSTAFSQYDFPIGSAGISLGAGWGIDGSWGIGTFSDNSFEHGWEVLLSFWTPDFSSGNPAGEEGTFSWLIPTDKTEKEFGISGGWRYLHKNIGAGVLLNYMSKVSYQNYRSDATGLSWHDPRQVENSFSITLNGVFRASDLIDINVYAGSKRYMAGISFKVF